MSGKYKNAMDKIVVSDELRKKIIAKTSEKARTAAPEKPAKRPRSYYLRYGIGYAACFLLCVSAVLTSRQVYSPDTFIPYTASENETAEEAADEAAPVNEKAVEPPSAAKDTGSITPKLPRQDNENAGPTAAPASAAAAKPDQKETFRSSDAAPPAASEQYEAELPTDAGRLFKEARPAEPQPPVNESAAKSSADSVKRGAHSGGGSAGGGRGGGGGGGGGATTGSASAFPIHGYVYQTSDDLANTAESVSEPLYSAEDIKEIQERVDYKFKLPQYVPENYILGDCNIMFGSLIEISYNSEDNNILYRTDKTIGDISGDSKEYEKVETEPINGAEVTLKSSDDLYYNAVWNDGNAYSLSVKNGMDKETLSEIIESVDYPASGNTGKPNDKASK